MDNNSLSVLNDNQYCEDLDIRVLNFEKKTLPPDWSLDRTAGKTCMLTYILEGRAACYVEGKPYLASKGDFVFVPDCTAYSAHGDRKKELACYLMEFEYSYKSGSGSELPLPTVFNAESDIVLNDLYKEMERTWEFKARGYRLMSRAIALQIFHELLFRTYRAQNTCKQSNRIEIIKEYVHKHYRNNIQLEDVAEILNLNPVYTGSYFKKRTGYSIKQYINHVRINQAKNLLASGDYTVTEVAQMCGYHDIFYFSKVFKQIEGVSPSYFQQ
ncbi:MAG: helix-turn-helix domain-containing protein [Caldicoprobacterales bacterium]|jgi:AraC family transcriptional regulator of arabinose operon|nr:helix-turn-helix transcriptional regulator [Clostridiales bacterium]